jgi:pyruvate formate lyase activating enzyme
MTKGIIFNIQKFSIHDGPGVRTTVFLKGCPLQCKWCSNPESQSEEIQILYDKGKCVHCQTCVHTCPHQAIQMTDDHIQIDHNKCVGCLSCVGSCLTDALTHEGEHKTVEEIVDVCLQDIDFYEESGGGVTISGGEGMGQPVFLKDLVTELKKHKIHVAIETTGYIKPEIFHEVAPLFDLLLFDVKHYDSDRHFAGTNVHNEQIIENLKWAIENGMEVLPRIPVIPGFNASLTDAKGIATLLKEVGANRVQLLPFHQFGERKYELLNREYALKNEKALYPEDLKDYQQKFLDQGLDCFF